MITVLFVCHANLDRSPTAVEVYGDFLVSKGYTVLRRNASSDADYEILSAGVHAEDEGIQVTKRMADRADIIFTMSEHQKELLMNDYSQDANKIKVLEITDRFSRGDSRLIKILQEKFEELG